MMNWRILFTAVSITLAIALASVAALWTHGTSASDILFVLFWPSIAVAILFSGNAHNFSTGVVYAAAALEIFTAVLLVVLAVRLLHRLRVTQR